MEIPRCPFHTSWCVIHTSECPFHSGSSMLGGYLIDMYGFETTFLITAALQVVSIACLIPLLCLVSNETRTPRPEAAATAATDDLKGGVVVSVMGHAGVRSSSLLPTTVVPLLAPPLPVEAFGVGAGPSSNSDTDGSAPPSAATLMAPPPPVPARCQPTRR
jgi:hypothetical protein